MLAKQVRPQLCCNGKIPRAQPVYAELHAATKMKEAARPILAKQSVSRQPNYALAAPTSLTQRSDAPMAAHEAARTPHSIQCIRIS